MKTVAIMQPYFAPYAGYFRLLCECDLFVIYDCVQFPRRGWVHRNKLPDASGNEQWLTLPISKAAQNTRIDELRFPADAKQIMSDRLNTFPLSAHDNDFRKQTLELLVSMNVSVVDYIIDTMRYFAESLGLPWSVIRSSSLEVSSSIRGQERIIEIAQRLEAGRYINAPGGRDLYDTSLFRDSGISLEFLPDYSGTFASILSRILTEDHRSLAKEIRSRS